MHHQGSDAAWRFSAHSLYNKICLLGGMARIVAQKLVVKYGMISDPICRKTLSFVWSKITDTYDHDLMLSCLQDSELCVSTLMWTKYSRDDAYSAPNPRHTAWNGSVYSFCKRCYMGYVGWLGSYLPLTQLSIDITPSEREVTQVSPCWWKLRCCMSPQSALSSYDESEDVFY